MRCKRVVFNRDKNVKYSLIQLYKIRCLYSICKIILDAITKCWKMSVEITTNVSLTERYELLVDYYRIIINRYYVVRIDSLYWCI